MTDLSNETPDIDVFAMITDDEGNQTLQQSHRNMDVEFYDIHIFIMKDEQPHTLKEIEDIHPDNINYMVSRLEKRYQTTADFM